MWVFVVFSGLDVKTGTRDPGSYSRADCQLQQRTVKLSESHSVIPQHLFYPIMQMLLTIERLLHVAFWHLLQEDFALSIICPVYGSYCITVRTVKRELRPSVLKTKLDF